MSKKQRRLQVFTHYLITSLLILLLIPITQAGDVDNSSNTANVQVEVALPKIVKYGIINETGENATDTQQDVYKILTFYFEVNESLGWFYVDYINFTAWYDWNESAIYNQTVGKNYNWNINYTNLTGTGSFQFLWPITSELEVLNYWDNVTSGDDTQHNISIQLRPGNQTRWAPGPQGSSWSIAPGYNNNFSWNFNFSVVDQGNNAVNISDEFGFYKYTQLALTGSLAGNGYPGQQNIYLGQIVSNGSANNTYINFSSQFWIDLPVGTSSGQYRTNVTYQLTTTATPLTLLSGTEGTGAIWNGKDAYIFGGSGSYRNWILRYNTTTGQTEQVGSLPSGRNGVSAVFNGSEDAFIFGGKNENGELNEIIKYNTTNNQVTTMSATLGSGRTRTTVAWNGSNEAYIIGGYNSSGGGTYINEILKYNPSVDTVTLTTMVLPTGRHSSCSVLANSKIYIFAGKSVSGALKDVIELDPVTKTVTTKSSQFSTGRYGCSAVWNGTHALIFGGRDNNNRELDEIWRYNPEGDILQRMNQRLPVKAYGTSAVYNGTHAIVFGGYDGSGYLDMIWVWRPNGGVEPNTGTVPQIGNGSAPGDKFGWNVTYGDVNGDGYYDTIVGAPYNDSFDGTKPDAGAIYIFFGFNGIADSSVNAMDANVTIYGSSPGDNFGWSLSANKSDVNGDGYDDLIVGAPNNASSRGSVYVFYGNSSWSTTAGTKYFYNASDANGTFIGASAGDRFGFSVAGIGNVNSTDTFMDFIVGAPFNDSAGQTDAGRAYIYLGDGYTLWSPTTAIETIDANLTIAGEQRPYEYFGWAVAGIGNANGDTLNDFVVGAPGRNRAYVYHGNTGIGKPGTGLFTHTSVVEFNAQSKYNINVTTIGGSDGDVLLADVGTGTITNSGLSNVDGIPDIYNESTTTGSVVDTQTNDTVAWNITETGDKNFYANSESILRGTLTNDYTYTFQSDNNYENITEMITTGGITDMLIAYGIWNVPQLQYALWTGTAWGSETTDGAFIATIENVRAKSNPTRNEIVVGAMAGDNTAPSDIYVNVWNGETDTWGTPLSVTSSAPYVPAFRQFDVCYETVSGDAVIFYAGGAGATLYYRVWNGATWSSPSTFSLTTISGNIAWIECASDPYNDEIAILVADVNSDAAGVIWNGNTIGNEQLLETALSINSEQCHDVAYEQVSGYAMFVWGEGANMQSRRWTNGTWEAEIASVNIGATLNWISLQADPNSNRLVLTSVNDSSGLNTVRWSGSAWTLDTEHDNRVETNARRNADAIFETVAGHEGHIILVYSDGAANDNWVYKHWDGTSTSEHP